MATVMNGGDQPMAKIQIAGPTLASLLQLVTTSPGDISGHVSDTTISITNALLLPDTHNIPNSSESDIIGWFSGRRLTPLRDSMTSSAMSKRHSPLIFLLITSPPPDATDSLIHTLEYRAYQYQTQSSPKFQPKSLTITNLGPSTSAIYDCFVPNSPFPGLASASRGSTVRVQDLIENADSDKQVVEGMGMDVGNVTRLVGPEAANHTKELEETVQGMLGKLEELTVRVHDTDPRVRSQLKTKKMMVVNLGKGNEKLVSSSLLLTRGKEREARLQC